MKIPRLTKRGRNQQQQAKEFEALLIEYMMGNDRLEDAVSFAFAQQRRLIHDAVRTPK